MLSILCSSRYALLCNSTRAPLETKWLASMGGSFLLVMF